MTYGSGVLPSSGPINFSDIASVFGGAVNSRIKLSNYYKDGTYVTSTYETSIPTSGTISVSTLMGRSPRIKQTATDTTTSSSSSSVANYTPSSLANYELYRGYPASWAPGYSETVISFNLPTLGSIVATYNLGPNIPQSERIWGSADGNYGSELTSGNGLTFSFNSRSDGNPMYIYARYILRAGMQNTDYTIQGPDFYISNLQVTTTTTTYTTTTSYSYSYVGTDAEVV